jgi:hypothetical protein
MAPEPISTACVINRSHLSVCVWNQPLNMSMRVCYLDCHEARLCCYLVIHIETLLHPLQLLYFHLWPIYWLSLVLNVILYEYYCVYEYVAVILTSGSR